MDKKGDLEKKNKYLLSNRFRGYIVSAKNKTKYNKILKDMDDLRSKKRDIIIF